MSIERLLRSSLIALVGLNLIIVGGISTGLVRNLQEEKTRELQQERVWAIARDIQNHLDDLQKELSYLQKVRNLAVFPPQMQRNILEGLTRQNHAYETLAIVNEDLEITSAIAPYTAENPRKIISSLIQQTDVLAAIQENKRYVDRIELNESLQLLEMTLVLPLQDDSGQPQGSLISVINLEFLNGIVARTEIGETGYMYIIDNQNRILVRQKHPIDLHEEKDGIAILNNVELIQRLSRRNSGHMSTYQGLRGIDVLGISSFIYGVNWRVVVELPLEEIYAPLRGLIIAKIVVLLVAIALSIFASIKIARLLISPLQSLTQAANSISQGNFSTQLIARQDNEWGVLEPIYKERIKEKPEEKSDR
ncbi:cache domain-containing protein [Roseofilum casamattae]|uniref:histidine kinase n=1 Tax=Roseofilum casamattae BLCC-M143 TaxID=3022442 RepID=A0ABT7C0L6_9CYAN|nr:cache domain-containing protein [Roseofilum casamattae]MDJ1184994.1 cache domain-containing protein [Roseofilum casamattae BLCC-M143]